MSEYQNAFEKDTNATLDYKWDWAGLTNGTGSADWLGAGETISTATVTVPAGITKSSQTNTTTTVTAWITGGTVGATYTVTCQIVTNQGRTDRRAITITVRDR